MVDRRQNKPGRGIELRGEILAAAFGLLDEELIVEAVTLRAVARRTGVSAPALYGHFRDVDDLRSVMRDQAFDELLQAADGAAGYLQDPVLGLLARCQAMATWGIQHPGRYRLLFTQINSAPNTVGYATFDKLIAAVESCMHCGRATVLDARRCAAHIVAALSGVALTRTTMPDFPWPALERSVSEIVTGIVGLVPNDTSG